LLSAVALYAVSAPISTTSSARSEDLTQAESIVRNKETVSDGITHPLESQAFVGGDYRLVISTADEWQTPTATARLYKEGEQLWQKTLPHQYGPKFALVSPTGQTLLLDEYINVASDYAIALINTDGQTTATYSFNDIHRTLQSADSTITRADIAEKAKFGWWITARPTMIKAGTHAHVETGGTVIQIDLERGTLTPSPS